MILSIPAFPFSITLIKYGLVLTHDIVVDKLHTTVQPRGIGQLQIASHCSFNLSSPEKEAKLLREFSVSLC